MTVESKNNASGSEPSTSLSKVATIFTPSLHSLPHTTHRIVDMMRFEWNTYSHSNHSPIRDFGLHFRSCCFWLFAQKQSVGTWPGEYSRYRVNKSLASLSTPRQFSLLEHAGVKSAKLVFFLRIMHRHLGTISLLHSTEKNHPSLVLEAKKGAAISHPKRPHS